MHKHHVFLARQILTKDSVTVSVDGVVYFRVSDPIASVANVANADFSTRLLAQTTLRNVLGTKNLAELLSDREGIAHSMQVWIRCDCDVMMCWGFLMVTADWINPFILWHNEPIIHLLGLF